MKFNRFFSILFITGISLSSCLISDYTGTIQVEVLKPGIFTIPDSIRTVAIANRLKMQPEDLKIGYSDKLQFITDTTINYQDLSNKCTDATVDFLREYGNFDKVINYRDTLNSMLNETETIFSPEELLEELNADMGVFLDYFNSDNDLIADENEIFFHSKPSLRWLVTYKNDPNFYYYDQHDTLRLDYADFNLYNLLNGKMQSVLNKCALIEGEYFGTKLIPVWMTVDRLYYKSGNADMQKAVQLALDNDWKGAAQIWNSETKNKNNNIATKAKFNMALACEMEGKPDLAIIWLTKSYNEYEGKNLFHKANCQRYINVLAIRQREIAKLDKQIK